WRGAATTLPKNRGKPIRASRTGSCGGLAESDLRLYVFMPRAGSSSRESRRLARRPAPVLPAAHELAKVICWIDAIGGARNNSVAWRDWPVAILPLATSTVGPRRFG